MTRHVLKVDFKYANAILNGKKSFEVRKNDRNFSFQRELEDRLQDVQGRGVNDREDARQHPHLPRHVLCTAGAR